MSLFALSTEPIFFCKMLDVYMAQTCPQGTVLVCIVDGDGQYEIDLLEHAFGEEGLSDVCSDIAGVCVIRFPEEVTVDEIVAQLQSSAAEMEYDDESVLGDMFRVYVNGEYVPF